MPDLGISPDLFMPLSKAEPQYFRFKMTEAIRKWVAGIESFQIEFQAWRDIDNRIDVSVTFTPEVTPSSHHLTFGWYSYVGPDWSNPDQLLRDIQLDGQPFTALR